MAPPRPPVIARPTATPVSATPVSPPRAAPRPPQQQHLPPPRPAPVAPPRPPAMAPAARGRAWYEEPALVWTVALGAMVLIAVVVLIVLAS
ncbi:hypothetical protein GCM10027575_86620 [Phytohabitans suffuscus]